MCESTALTAMNASRWNAQLDSALKAAVEEAAFDFEVAAKALRDVLRSDGVAREAIDSFSADCCRLRFCDIEAESDEEDGALTSDGSGGDNDGDDGLPNMGSDDHLSENPGRPLASPGPSQPLANEASAPPHALVTFEGEPRFSPSKAPHHTVADGGQPAASNQEGEATLPPRNSLATEISPEGAGSQSAPTLPLSASSNSTGELASPCKSTKAGTRDIRDESENRAAYSRTGHHEQAFETLRATNKSGGTVEPASAKDLAATTGPGVAVALALSNEQPAAPSREDVQAAEIEALFHQAVGQSGSPENLIAEIDSNLSGLHSSSGLRQFLGLDEAALVALDALDEAAIEFERSEANLSELGEVIQILEGVACGQFSREPAANTSLSAISVARVAFGRGDMDEETVLDRHGGSVERKGSASSFSSRKSSCSSSSSYLATSSDEASLGKRYSSDIVEPCKSDRFPNHNSGNQMASHFHENRAALSERSYGDGEDEDDDDDDEDDWTATRARLKARSMIISAD